MHPLHFPPHCFAWGHPMQVWPRFFARTRYAIMLAAMATKIRMITAFFIMYSSLKDVDQQTHRAFPFSAYSAFKFFSDCLIRYTTTAAMARTMMRPAMAAPTFREAGAVSRVPMV